MAKLQHFFLLSLAVVLTKTKNQPKIEHGPFMHLAFQLKSVLFSVVTITGSLCSDNSITKSAFTPSTGHSYSCLENSSQ